jgi:ATPase subunit of ABC transporter with duplicated ATPase domains
LARALVHAPSVLLLDEPTTGLDVAGVTRLLGVLHEETDAVVVVVTHESERFEAFGARRILLERGRVVVADPVTTEG